MIAFCSAVCGVLVGLVAGRVWQFLRDEQEHRKAIQALYDLLRLAGAEKTEKALARALKRLEAP